MVKKFHLYIPKKIKEDKIIKSPKVLDPRIKTVDVGGDDIKIPELKPGDLPPFEPFPPRWVLESLVNNYGGDLSLDPPNWGTTPIEHWQYVDHRQMDTGRAIAQNRHPRRAFVERVGDIWEFQEITHTRVPNPDYNPDFILTPKPRDYSTKYETMINVTSKSYYVEWDGVLPFPPSTASSSSFTGRDSYMWAVYFIVNGFPPASEWFPIPSRNPNWNSLGIGEFVPPYFIPAWWEF